jgi:plasmid maintenance system antidote protein VapI
MKRLPAQCFPAAEIVKDELEARGVSLDAFLNVIGMRPERWEALVKGEYGMLLKECQSIAGALGLSMEFVVNLNFAYQQWKNATESGAKNG